MGDTGTPTGTTWAEQVRELADRRDAVILAHNYQRPEIQDVADHVGDSLALARIAATTPHAEIVLCGVHFMAETAKILSPGKRVLIPDARAGCSLADTIDEVELRAWKHLHPGAVVVAYVNTSAAVKAESDICCTSSNAADVVRSVPSGTPILFLPDRHLGEHVKRVTGRQDIHVWQGQCHVHEGITAQALRARVEADPEADVLVHPECACATSALELASSGAVAPERVRILSTGGMLDQVRRTATAAAGGARGTSGGAGGGAGTRTAVRRVLVATETGMLHQLRRANPGVTFEAVSDRAVCSYMKMITAENLLRCLQEGRDEVHVDEAVARAARTSVERMIAIGSPSAGGE